MCGRIVQVHGEKRITDAFSLRRVPRRPDSWNLAPMQDATIVGLSAGERVARVHRWGLVPSWVRNAETARKIGAACINARADSVADKPAFRTAFARRRCIVPVDGWFEWARESAAKQPYYFHGAGDEVLALAGLWEAWTDPASGDEVRTFAVITTEPNASAAHVHDRMPVVLSPATWDAWLAPTTPHDELLAMLVPCPDEVIAAHPVGKAVGNVRNNSPDLILPLRAA